MINSTHNVSAWNIALNVLQYTILIIFAVITLQPLLWAISTSLKSNSEIFAVPPQWIPSIPQWSNFEAAWTLAPFQNFYLNTVYITALIVLGQLITSSMAGFAFARLKFPGRNVLFMFYLAALMIPSQVIMIPIFLMVRDLGWINSHLSLIIPSLAGPFGTFLFRQFFLAIPEELADAARIDGCTNLGIYWRIFLPLSKPALATLGIFTALNTWNSFLWPLILIRSPELYTVTQGLGLLRGLNQFEVPWELVMAGTVTAMIPIVIVFLLAQRYFIEGITLTGIKG
jgi:multiple sugar transport system permease protein